MKKKRISEKQKKDALERYIQHLESGGFPVIFGSTHLAQILNLTPCSLAGMINHSDFYYYSYEIPKHSGGMRRISAPNPSLSAVQRWILDTILCKIELKKAAVGYRRGMSIVDNAQPHLCKERVLKMDLRDFFPSITLNRVWYVFRNCGYTKRVSYYLASLCCLNGCLPQGACTSPTLSNIIAKRLDARLMGMCERFDVNYTRYADDLTFSSDNLPARFIDYVIEIAEDEKFQVNSEKTKLLGKNSQKIITGISISQGEIKVPRKYKRSVRQEVYYVLKYGIINHQEHIGKRFDVLEVERLIGKLCYWESLEPDNAFVKEFLPQVKLYSRELDGMK